jgi:hypothetical protein
MLERQIEKKVCDYAKSKGMLVYKFNSPSRAAVPDRLFITPHGRMFFIEFKRTGQSATPAQVREIDKLMEHYVWVFVVDTVDDGNRIIDRIAILEL